MIPDEGGVLAVDKPVGPTSHDVVALARRALRTRKVGHTGTLDPFASGLLLLCVGPATRLSGWLTRQPKVYEARARLGEVTPTLDPESEVVERRDGWEDLDEDEIRAVMAGFVGDIEQRPPVYSAKKVGGEAAHRRARRGEAVELAPIQVHISELTLLEWDPPELAFRVACSSGTYVRALARDLGEALGVGAYLVGLRRTAVGAVTLSEAVSAEALEEGEVGREEFIRPARALTLAGLPAVTVDDSGARRLAAGQRIATEEAVQGDVAVVLGDGSLVAVAECGGGRLQPRKVFLRT